MLHKFGLFEENWPLRKTNLDIHEPSNHISFSVRNFKANCREICFIYIVKYPKVRMIFLVFNDTKYICQLMFYSVFVLKMNSRWTILLLNIPKVFLGRTFRRVIPFLYSYIYFHTIDTGGKSCLMWKSQQFS